MWRVLRSRDGWELPGTFSCSRRPSQLPTLPFRDLSTDCHSTPIRGGKTGELRFGRMQEQEDRSAVRRESYSLRGQLCSFPWSLERNPLSPAHRWLWPFPFNVLGKMLMCILRRKKRWCLSLLWRLCWWMRKPQHSAQTWIFLSVFLHTRKF